MKMPATTIEAVKIEAVKIEVIKIDAMDLMTVVDRRSDAK